MRIVGLDESQICRWYHPNGRKQRGTKEPLDEGERGEQESWLKTQHSENEDHGIQSHQLSSVQSLSRFWLFATPRIAARQASLSISQTHVHQVGDPIQLSHPLLSPSPHAPNPSRHQSFPMSQLFTWGGQSIGVSALASVLPMNTRDWSPLGWTGWISLQSKGLSRVFSNTTVQKHQFFCPQLSSQSNSHIHTWLLEKP